MVYAHPSERYLRIIREGAAHSCLASDFKEHLATLRPYKYAVPQVSMFVAARVHALKCSASHDCNTVPLLLIYTMSSFEMHTYDSDVVVSYMGGETQDMHGWAGHRRVRNAGFHVDPWRTNAGDAISVSPRAAAQVRPAIRAQVHQHSREHHVGAAQPFPEICVGSWMLRDQDTAGSLHFMTGLLVAMLFNC